MVQNKGTQRLWFANGTASYTGVVNEAALFMQNEQLTDAPLWVQFVDQFRYALDGDTLGWRGEYWGKMMRGAVLIYQYTGDSRLYDVMTDTVRDMLTVADMDGRVSSYARTSEFDAWDMWCRKYVLLGLEYYIDVCRDEALKGEIIGFLCRAADVILAHIGPADEGKKEINTATRHWLGLNSSSILEPMVRLYRLTGDMRYLDFASYIVERGGADGVPVFELAYENRLYPYQYGVAKAYEMMSCFEGLLEYYLVTGVEKHRTAVVNFVRAVADSDVTVIGSCGCTHELFDHSAARQTAPCITATSPVMQETCVTVTWLKLCARVLALTGDAYLADCMELSYYNAYLGSLNIHHRVCGYMREKHGAENVTDVFLPFDSYSPLTAGVRGLKIGGNQLLSDGTYYGCCACIGAAGQGMFTAGSVMQSESGVYVMQYVPGSVHLMHNGVPVTITLDTAYPADGRIRLTVKAERPVSFSLYLRLPAWSEHTELNAPCSYAVRNGYAVLDGTWETPVTVTMTLDMRLRALRPLPWEEDDIYDNFSQTLGKVKVYHDVHRDEYDRHVCLRRGPLTLCADERLGKAPDSVFSFEEKNGVPVLAGLCENTFADAEPCMVQCELRLSDGETARLIDYASAGRDWKSRIAAWLPTA